ncbi:MAG: glycosyltransferase family 9 protein [Candidatus Methylacidiphilales bacterium]|nr:glycosyltransferase family 9 protein [Candidatus Methylacidiphilales bacterium]
MRPAKITVVEWHQMGDAVMALPFIHGAREAGIEVTACATPGPASVIQLAFPDLAVGIFRPDVDNWWRGDDWGGWRQKHGADTAVCAWGDPRTHFWMKRAGFDRRIGLPAVPNNCYAREAAFLRPCLRETQAFGRLLNGLAGPLLTEAWLRPRRDLHHQDNWGEMARMLGFSVNELFSWPVVPAPGLKSAGRRNSYWVVHSGGRLLPKRWSGEKWRELLIRLRALDVSTVWVRSQGMDDEVELPPGQEVFEAGGLRGFAELVAGARGLIGLDSFPAHLSASMGKDTVVLFGEMPDVWFAPRGPHVRVMKKPMTEGCLRDYVTKGLSLLRELEVDEVVAAVKASSADNR